MWVGQTNLTPLIKALAKFDQFRVNDKTEQERAGIVQAFEYSFELTWKMMRRLLAERGLVYNSPREVFRAAALEQLINDPEIWFEFLKKRNLTAHVYQQEYADAVISICADFSREVKLFLAPLEANDA